MDTFKNVRSHALVSVYDKKNIKFLCEVLKQNKIGIVSTGSTHKKIKSLGFTSLKLSRLTKFDEVLDGRVKTLHPKIYISILYNRNDTHHRKIFSKTKFPKIDYVIVNLYPFEKIANKSFNKEEVIEMIDIGGPSLLRSSGIFISFSFGKSLISQ